MKVSLEGTDPLFIRVKLLKSPNDKEFKRTKFRNDTLPDRDFKVGIINTLFWEGVPRVTTLQKGEGTFENPTFSAQA